MNGLRNAWDLVAILSLSVLLIAIIYLYPESNFRKVIGLAFILFFPGYSLISFLFPENRDLDKIERIALSFGLSIAITPLIGLILNFTPFGIGLSSILFSLASFNVLFSLLAIKRRFGARDPFVPRVGRKAIGWEGMGKLDKILTLILAIAILASIFALIYVITTPKQGEKFTEFYILGEKGKASDYPTRLRIGQNASVIIGIANHEYGKVNYTIEIWLVNASYVNNRTIIHHMYFLDGFRVTLDHTPVSVEGNWTPQWEKLYTFSIDKAGRYKLWFLLFKDQAPASLERMKDYAGTEAEWRILDAVEGKIQSLNLNVVVREI
jgi:uncharacterized membrane protein